MTTPTHEYETIEGTKPAALVEHEPRTITHAVDGGDLHMMTEIGDGTFVQWSTCRKCSKRIVECKCAGGPVEPDHLKKWRGERFERSLNERPDPDARILGSVIEWVKALGYEVSKPAPEPEPEPEDSENPTCETCGEPYSEYGDGWNGECPDCADKSYAKEFPDESEGVDPEKIDDGLDAALEKVRAARDDMDFLDDVEDF